MAERESALYRRTLMRIKSLFDSRGLETIVLKGTGLSFGEPRDIDLLAGEGAILEAIAALEASGYEPVR